MHVIYPINENKITLKLSNHGWRFRDKNFHVTMGQIMYATTGLTEVFKQSFTGSING